MTQELNCLAIITARGGSKRLPRKNVKPFCGKPLIAWSIEAALQSGVVDRVLVSTDDDEIAQVAQAYGAEVPFRRPANLATDSASGDEAFLHALNWLAEAEAYRPDWVICLQPTSPLREASDVRAALELAWRQGWREVAGFGSVPVSRATLWEVQEDGSCQPSLAKDLPGKTYALNGALYAIETNLLLAEGHFLTSHLRAYLMPAERSVDIDDALDFTFAEQLKSEQVP